jgi:hypothetical protein
MKLAKILSILIVLSLSTAAIAQLATSPSGGPDSYGYRWKTSLASGATIPFTWQDVLAGSQADFVVSDDFRGPYRTI